MRQAALLAIAIWTATAGATPNAPDGYNPFSDPDFGKPDKRMVGVLDGSYAKCLLDRLPGVANDVAAQQIANACMHEFPDALNTVERGSTLFGYATAAECVIKKSRDTASRQAAQMISFACYHRYPR